MIKPREIVVIAPAGGWVSAEEIAECSNIFLNQGFEVNIPENMLAETLFCSNTDEYRYGSLVEALQSDSGIIFALRGGYGTSRILEKLLTLPKPKHEKVFVGFSDVTALHIFLHQQWGWQPIHGMTMRQAAATYQAQERNPENLSLLIKILNRSVNQIKVEDLKPLNNKASFSDIIQGQVTGGNLSMVQTTIGTSWEVMTSDKILILEDISEAAYRVDRMLQHLIDAKKLDSIRALILGEFYACPDSHGLTVQSALERVASVLNERSIPVFQTKYIGHGYHNYPFVYGSSMTIKSENGGFVFTSNSIESKY